MHSMSILCMLRRGLGIQLYLPSRPAEVGVIVQSAGVLIRVMWHLGRDTSIVPPPPPPLVPIAFYKWIYLLVHYNCVGLVWRCCSLLCKSCHHFCDATSVFVVTPDKSSSATLNSHQPGHVDVHMLVPNRCCIWQILMSCGKYLWCVQGFCEERQWYCWPS